MATFTTKPLYSYQRGINHNVLITEFESGKEQRKYLGVRARTWTVGFRGTLAKIAEVESFYNDRKGAFEAFTWTPPGISTAISVRFEENSLSVNHSGSLYAECEVTIREII